MVEVYEYENEVKRGYTRPKRKPKRVPLPEPPKLLTLFSYQEHNRKLEEKRIEKEKIQKQKTEFSIRRTKRQIKRLINSNSHLKKFLTLTFADNIESLEQANYLFMKFILKMKYRDPKFEYIAVNEFQKRGAVHYHIICNIADGSFASIEENRLFERNFARDIWTHGFVKLKDVRDVTDLGQYFCKYLSKDMFDERTFGKKKFFRSQTLSKPVEILGALAKAFIDRFISTLKPRFEVVIESEWVGKIKYASYALDEAVNIVACVELDYGEGGVW